jgi:hypothetical protein
MRPAEMRESGRSGIAQQSSGAVNEQEIEGVGGQFRRSRPARPMCMLPPKPL